MEPVLDPILELLRFRSGQHADTEHEPIRKPSLRILHDTNLGRCQQLLVCTTSV